MVETGKSGELAAMLPPELAGRVQSARASGGAATVVMDASGWSAAERADAERAVRDAMVSREDIAEVRVAFTAERRQRRMIAIGSGKGGVGKSTLTANLAAAFAARGTKTGVIDADIYGPSQPKLLGQEAGRPEAPGKQLVPLDTPHGVRMLSMGSLVAPGKALAWRGPMAGGALGQLVDADWGDTELLLVDLPPGTGDVQISMLQKHRPDGAVIVSTPQDLALIDAARAGQLFEQGEVPIVGLVENMAGYACPHCGEVSDPFGQGGVETFAERLDIPFLGRIPLAIDIRQAADSGRLSVGDGDPQRQAFAAIADGIAQWLAEGHG